MCLGVFACVCVWLCLRKFMRNWLREFFVSVRLIACVFLFWVCVCLRVSMCLREVAVFA